MRLPLLSRVLLDCIDLFIQNHNVYTTTLLGGVFFIGVRVAKTRKERKQWSSWRTRLVSSRYTVGTSEHRLSGIGIRSIYTIVVHSQ